MRLSGGGTLRAGGALLLVLLAAAADAGEVASPREVVESIEQAVLDALAHAPAAMNSDPQRLYELARTELKPHFDLERAGRYILGTVFKSASTTEREAFREAFEDYLVTSYATALRHVNSATFTVTGEPRPVGGDEAILPVRIKLVDGDTLDAELRLRLGPTGWRIWDAGTEGTSMVRLYRRDIGTEAAVHGLAQTINSLKEIADRNRVRNLEEARKRATRAPSR